MQAHLSLAETLDFIFLKNVRDLPIKLNLWQLDGPYDLFLFFIDIVCKGLVLLYGEGITRIRFDTITREQIMYVTKKLKNAGIELVIETRPINTDNNVNMCPIYIVKAPPETSLTDFKLVMALPECYYDISFKLIRVGLRGL
jgi:hypothetical protein